MRSTPNDLIHYSPMGVRRERQASPVFGTTAVANNRVCGVVLSYDFNTFQKGPKYDEAAQMFTTLAFPRSSSGCDTQRESDA